VYVGLALCAQPFAPPSAHVTLYFPHFADGGPSTQRWQTSITLTNPDPTFSVPATISLMGDAGEPLALTFDGIGTNSTFNLTIPPRGVRVLRSSAVSTNTRTGWIEVNSALPLNGVVSFRMFEGSAAKYDVSALPTLPTLVYTNPANANLGLALVNTSRSDTAQVDVLAYDQDGRLVGQVRNYRLPARAHSAFNLREIVPGLLATFEGSVEVRGSSPSTRFAAWALGVSSFGTLTTLPPGNGSQPISHPDRIRLVFNRCLFAAAQIAASFGIDLSRPTLPVLVIDPGREIQARSFSDGRVSINLSMSELAGDSDSELAHLIAHEISHQLQFRSQRGWLLHPRPEVDADALGVIISLNAGYDPYGAAGFIGKTATVLQETNLRTQYLQDLFADHPSFSSRLQIVFDTLRSYCATSRDVCSLYKTIFHPSFPNSIPLLERPSMQH
jgi:hypothetical protein